MEKLAMLVPLFPLIGFLYVVFFGKGLSKNFIGWTTSGAVLSSFVVSVVLFTGQLSHGHSSLVNVFDWIGAGNLHVGFSFLVDPLSSVYLLFITGVGFLIHVYSIGYMQDDEGFSRFMAYLNLFVFFMLLLVLGDSYLLAFAGWEGVGLCSFMLIGFWYKDMANNDAAKKAFIFNRVGDLGFILAMTLLFYYTHTLSFTELFEGGKISSLGTAETTSIAILLFVGAMGKSAQFPLHNWLPDAMAGPTPVSALIHAATMVTAGIYLVARSGDLFSASEMAGAVVTLVGILTAILGATIALVQNDIKKVLAYSTVSQLGLMFVALGLGAYSIAVFHVITHAFFKALLFLGSGSVIHAAGGEQDIRRMGGLKKYLPTTHLTFLLGCLAISGIVPFAGFFSKDQIIATAWELNPVVFVLAIGVSALTAFYMFRLYFLTFHGKFRGTHEQEHHLHESPKVMTVPLMILAVFSVIGGFIGFPHAIGHAIHFHHWLDHFLEPTNASMVLMMEAGVISELLMMLAATAVAILAIWYAYNIYYRKKMLAPEDNKIDSSLHHILKNKYWLDEIYDTIIRKPLDGMSSWAGKFIEPKVIDRGVEGAGKIADVIGQRLKLAHSGHLAFYLLAMIAGLLVLLITLL